MGSLYKQKSRDGTPGRVWWARYYVNGRAVRESTGTEKRTEAERFMKAREGRVATGQPILPRADRIRYEEVAQDLRAYYQTTGRRDLVEARVGTVREQRGGERERRDSDGHRAGA